jgi:hypothetical protein
MVESGWRIQRQTSACVNKLLCHFVPEDDKESDRAENEEACDAEMGENGADIAVDTMDETLH